MERKLEGAWHLEEVNLVTGHPELGDFLRE
jgi:hypothetical protein